MRVWGMHERTQIKLSATDRAALKAVVANRNSQDRHLALAGAVWLRGCCRAVARQDATVAHPAIEPRYCRTRGGLDLGWPARARDPLDRRGHGQSGRDQRQFGPAHLARPWPAAPPDASVQAVQ